MVSCNCVVDSNGDYSSICEHHQGIHFTPIGLQFHIDRIRKLSRMKHRPRTELEQAEVNRELKRRKAVASKKYREKNKETLKAKAKVYRKANPPKVDKAKRDAYLKEYNAKNAEIIKAKQHAKYLRTKEAGKIKRKAYYEANKEKLKEARIKYVTENREKVLEQKRNSSRRYYVKNLKKDSYVSN